MTRDTFAREHDCHREILSFRKWSGTIVCCITSLSPQTLVSAPSQHPQLEMVQKVVKDEKSLPLLSPSSAEAGLDLDDIEDAALRDLLQLLETHLQRFVAVTGYSYAIAFFAFFNSLQEFLYLGWILTCFTAASVATILWQLYHQHEPLRRWVQTNVRCQRIAFPPPTDWSRVQQDWSEFCQTLQGIVTGHTTSLWTALLVVTEQEIDVLEDDDLDNEDLLSDGTDTDIVIIDMSDF